MGQKLVEYFDRAKVMGGMKAQMRLVILAKVSSPKAKEIPDSADNIRIFDIAMKELEKEFKLGGK